MKIATVPYTLPIHTGIQTADDVPHTQLQVRDTTSGRHDIFDQ